MIKNIFLIIFVLPFFVFTKPLKLNDINIVMDQVFEYHIDYKNYDEVLIQRSFKIFIDQFDNAKIYLLNEDVENYLNLSKSQAKKILHKVKNGDFSDYYKLNEIFQKAIFRARDTRAELNNVLILSDIDNVETQNSYNSFAKDFNDLSDRQKNSMIIFYQAQNKKTSLKKQKKQKIFNLLEKRFARNENLFLENLNEDTLASNILKSFTKSLDAHSYYFSEDEASQMRLSLENEFEGVGVVLQETVDGVTVADLVKKSPAKDSGVIQKNDILVEVNGVSIEHMDFDKVMKLMKYSETPYLILGFKRVSDDASIAFWKVKLEKKPITMDDQRLDFSYEPYEDGIIGKLELKSFYENSNGITSEKDIKMAIKKLKKINDLKGLILDLRENSGGFLSQAIKVASLFVKNGVIVVSKNSKNEKRYLRNIDKDAYYNGPLIILTSKLSASASEIVAAALQDYGVALIVGEQETFGKGSIQYQTITDKKADYYYKVTVGKYYTVSGRTTQMEGVKADIVIPSKFSVFKIGEKYLQYPLKPDKIKPSYNDNLSDLDSRIKSWFNLHYTPNLQKKVIFWQKMKPFLKENSEKRVSENKDFQNFFIWQKKLKAKLDGEEVEIDIDTNFGDIQMKESVNILKDMIRTEVELKQAAGL